MAENFHFLSDNFGSEVVSLVEQRVGSLYYDGQLDDVNCVEVKLDYIEVR